MVKIINPMQGENPLAAVLSGLGQQMFGDRSGGMLKAEQLYAAQRENMEKDLLAQEYLKYGTPEFDPRRVAARSGLAGDTDYANRQLYLAGNIDGAESQAATNAGVGAGGAYSSTYGGFAKTLAEAARANNMQSADNRYDVDQRVAEDARQFNMTPEPVMLNGTPSFVPRSGIFGDGSPAIPPQPIMSLTEAQGGAFNRNPPAPGSLSEAVAIGTAPTQSQAQADILLSMDNAGALTDVQRRVAAGAQPNPGQIQAQIFQDNQGNLAGMDPITQRFLGVAPPAPPAAPNVRDYIKDGRTYNVTNESFAQGVDVQGNPVPPGGNFVTSNVQDTAENFQLTNSNLTAAQRAVSGGEAFNYIADKLRVIAAADPTAFGLLGSLQQLSYSAMTFLDNVGELAGGRNFEEGVQATASRIMDNPDLDPSLKEHLLGQFNPNVPKLQSLAGMLSYVGGEQIANQSGRDLATADVVKIESILGNPTGMTATAADFLVRLNEAQEFVKFRVAQNLGLLQSGVGGPPAAPGATQPSITPPAGNPFTPEIFTPQAPTPAQPQTGQPIEVINPAGQRETLRESRPGVWQRLRPDGAWEPVR